MRVPAERPQGTRYALFGLDRSRPAARMALTIELRFCVNRMITKSDPKPVGSCGISTELHRAFRARKAKQRASAAEPPSHIERDLVHDGRDRLDVKIAQVVFTVQAKHLRPRAQTHMPSPAPCRFNLGEQVRACLNIICHPALLIDFQGLRCGGLCVIQI
jgi:hypothetical protein